MQNFLRSIEEVIKTAIGWLGDIGRMFLEAPDVGTGITIGLVLMGLVGTIIGFNKSRKH